MPNKRISKLRLVNAIKKKKNTFKNEHIEDFLTDFANSKPKILKVKPNTIQLRKFLKDYLNAPLPIKSRDIALKDIPKIARWVARRWVNKSVFEDFAIGVVYKQLDGGYNDPNITTFPIRGFNMVKALMRSKTVEFYAKIDTQYVYRLLLVHNPAVVQRNLAHGGFANYCYDKIPIIPELYNCQLFHVDQIDAILNNKDKDIDKLVVPHLSENCFVNCLIQLNVKDDIISRISASIKDTIEKVNGLVNNKMLRTFSDTYKLKFVVWIVNGNGIAKQSRPIIPESKGSNEKNTKVVKLFIYNYHYYPLLQTNNTSYSITNYEKILASGRGDRWYDCSKAENYDLKRTKRINTLKVITTMIKCGYIVSLGENESEWHKKCNQTTIIDSRKYNTIPILRKYKEGKPKNNDKIIIKYADFEADITKEYHVPIMVAITNIRGSIDVFSAKDDCEDFMIDFFDSIIEGVDDGGLVKCYFHNLGYDSIFLMSFKSFMISSAIKKSASSCISLRGKYKGVMIEFKDSNAFTACKLSKFPKMFKLDDHKGIFPYSLINRSIESKIYSVKDCCQHIAANTVNVFLKEIKGKPYVNGDKIDLWSYMNEYCIKNIKGFKQGIEFEYRTVSDICTLEEFSKVFSLDKNKDKFPYILLDKTDNRIYSITKCCEKIDVNKLITFRENLKGKPYINGDEIDLWAYMEEYCVKDVILLRDGVKALFKWFKEGLGINLHDYLTIASLADAYFKKGGAFDGCYAIGGFFRSEIQKCVNGGRVMTCENKMINVYGEIADFDLTSCYPSAVIRSQGYLMGKPTRILDEDLEKLQDNLTKWDGLYMSIEILSIGLDQKFPLIRYYNEEKQHVDYVNRVGIVYIDKIGLEDLVNFQKITYRIISAIGFNKGFNNKSCELMQGLLDEKQRRKANKDPSAIIYKLIMNSSYGRTIMKPIETNSHYFRTEKEFNIYRKRNVKFIMFSKELSDICWVVHTYRSDVLHFSYPQIGASILSMSKRLMNEVICLAQELGINVYYTDTDSMHIDNYRIAELAKAYEKKYDRVLIGNKAGQFHSDFKNGLYSFHLIGLDKKSYLDEMSNDTNHVRMKGVTGGCIKDPLSEYTKMFNGQSINYDLCDVAPVFRFDGLHCSIRSKFPRLIKFSNPNKWIISMDEYKVTRKIYDETRK